MQRLLQHNSQPSRQQLQSPPPEGYSPDEPRELVLSSPGYSPLPPIMAATSRAQQRPSSGEMWLDRHIESLGDRIRSNEAQQTNMLREMARIQAEVNGSFRVFDTRLSNEEANVQGVLKDNLTSLRTTIGTLQAQMMAMGRQLQGEREATLASLYTLKSYSESNVHSHREEMRGIIAKDHDEIGHLAQTVQLLQQDFAGFREQVSAEMAELRKTVHATVSTLNQHMQSTAGLAGEVHSLAGSLSSLSARMDGADDNFSKVSKGFYDMLITTRDTSESHAAAIRSKLADNDARLKSEIIARLDHISGELDAERAAHSEAIGTVHASVGLRFQELEDRLKNQKGVNADVLYALDRIKNMVVEVEARNAEKMDHVKHDVVRLMVEMRRENEQVKQAIKSDMRKSVKPLIIC